MTECAQEVFVHAVAFPVTVAGAVTAGISLPAMFPEQLVICLCKYNMKNDISKIIFLFFSFINLNILIF